MARRMGGFCHASLPPDPWTIPRLHALRRTWLTSAENGRHHAGIASSVENGDDPQWVLVGGVRNQVVTHALES